VYVPPVVQQVRGNGVNEAKQLQGLEEENRRLKKIVADQALDDRHLKRRSTESARAR